MKLVARFLVVFVGLLITGEIIVRIFITSPSIQQFDSELGWEYIPNSCYYSSKEGGARLCFNSYGLNDDEIREKGNKFRVLVLGDSFVEANHVQRKDNFTSVIERKDPTIDVINAGRNGMNAVDYLTRVRRYKNAMLSDLIVVGFSAGEIADLRDSANLKVYRSTNGEITDIRVGASNKDRLKELFNPIIQRSAFATYLMRRTKPIMMGMISQSRKVLSLFSEASGSESSAKGNTRYRSEKEAREILSFVLGEINNIKPVVLIYFPVLDYRENRTAVEANKRIGEQYKEIADKLGIRFVNLDSSLKKSYRETGQPPQGFQNSRVGIGHLNIQGHMAVGNALYPLFSQYKKLVKNQ